MIIDNIYDFACRVFYATRDFCLDFYELLFTEFDFLGVGTVTLFDFVFAFTVGLLVYRIIARIILH